MRGLSGVLLLVMLLGPLAAVAQALPVRRLTVADGLASNSVNALTQTPDGRLWIATLDGISTFDGQQVLHANPECVNTTALTAGPDGRRWAGTRAGQVWCLGPGAATRRIVPQRLVTRPVAVTALAPSPDGRGLWVGTLDEGLFWVRWAAARPDTVVRAFRSTEGVGGCGRIWTLCFDGAGHLLVGTQCGLAVLDATSGRLLTTDTTHARLNGPRDEKQDVGWRHLVPARAYPRLAGRERAGVWCATSTEVLRLHPTGEPTRPWTTTCVYPAATFGGQQPRRVLEDRVGNLWVLTTHGLYCRTPTADRWRCLRTGYFTVGTYKFALLEDREGSVWAINGFAGVEQYLPDQRFTLYPAADGLLHPWVNRLALMPGAPTQLWVSTDGGLVRFAPDAPASLRSTPVRWPDGTLLGPVWPMIVDRRGDLWLDIYREAILRVPMASGPAPRVERVPALAGPAFCTNTLAEDRRGRIWLSRAGGLAAYDPVTRRRWLFDLEFANDYTTTILAPPDGRLWAASSSGGGLVEIIWPDSAAAPRFARVPGVATTTGFNCLTADSAGVLWLAGGDHGQPGGIWRYDPRRAGAQVEPCRFPAAGPAPTNALFVRPDTRGHVWIGTRAALYCYTPGSGALERYGVADGLLGADISANSAVAMPDGRLWWGSSEGLVCYDPSKVRRNRVAPTPRITGTQLFLRDTALAGGTRLPFQQNHLTFRYIGISLIHPEKVRYRYRLVGFDDDHWTAPVATASATFTNLPPGEYRFEVTAANNDGVWSRRAARFAFTIAPPWWRTGWAYAAYAVLGAAVGGWAFGLVRRRERAHADRLAQAQNLLRLRELDRVKTEFFTNISHEFRTPLTLILGPAESLATEADASASVRQRGELVRRNARQLLTLTNQLLELSKLEAGALRLHATAEPDISARVRPLVAQFASLAESRQLTLALDLPAAPVPLVCDALRLDLVLTNLLANALKFTPPGGTVTVRVREVSAGPAAPRGAVALVVRDTGPGIAPEHHTRLFERFYQVTDEAAPAGRPGTGVGLALVRELVILHGGTVTVESVPGQGATFTVVLPHGLVAGTNAVAPEPPAGLADVAVMTAPADSTLVAPSQATNAAPAETVDEPLTVLIVEDNADVRAFVEATLAPVGYRLLLAADGQAGLETARAEVPDLVVSDVMMPRMDGYQLCAALKRDVATSHIPVVLLTARASADDKIEGLETGADAFVAKPFAPRELLAQVRNLLALRQRVQARFSALDSPLAADTSDLPPRVALPPATDPLAAHAAAVAALPSLDQQFLTRVEAAVAAHLDDSAFGVEALAEAVFLGRAQLHRKLKALTGQAPSDYVRTTRLLRAHALLAARTGTVAEVAYQVGFSAPTHFSTMFSRQFGYAPSEVPARAGAPAAPKG